MTDQEELKKLREENETLKRRLANLQKRLKAYQSYDNRRHQHDQDYLPYEDDDRRGD